MIFHLKQKRENIWKLVTTPQCLWFWLLSFFFRKDIGMNESRNQLWNCYSWYPPPMVISQKGVLSTTLYIKPKRNLRDTIINQVEEVHQILRVWTRRSHGWRVTWGRWRTGGSISGVIQMPTKKWTKRKLNSTKRLKTKQLNTESSYALSLVFQHFMFTPRRILQTPIWSYQHMSAHSSREKIPIWRLLHPSWPMLRKISGTWDLLTCLLGLADLLVVCKAELQ